MEEYTLRMDTKDAVSLLPDGYYPTMPVCLEEFFLPQPKDGINRLILLTRRKISFEEKNLVNETLRNPAKSALLINSEHLNHFVRWALKNIPL